MHLSNFLKYYHLSVQQLEKILQENKLEYNLRTIRDIPEQWNELVNQHTGITKMEGKLNLFSEGNNVQKSIDVTENITDSSEQNKQDKIETQVENKANYFLAYVKFIAKDNSHGFIKRIDNINTIGSIDLRKNDQKDYSIGRQVKRLQINQIVICSKDDSEDQPGRVPRARFISANFTGTLIETATGVKFTDWISLKDPFLLKSNFNIKENINFFCSINFFYYRTLTYTILQEEPIIEAIQKSINNSFQKSIQKESFDELDNMAIKAYKKQIDDQEYKAIISKIIEQDIASNKCFENEVSILEYIKKWNILDSEFLHIGLVKDKIPSTQLIDSWIQKLVPLKFWDNVLIETFLQYFIDNKFSSVQSLQFKSKLNEQQLNIVQEGLDSYLEDLKTIETSIIYDYLISIANYYTTEIREKYTSIIKQHLSQNLKLQLWQENKLNEFPKAAVLKFFRKLDRKVQVEVLNILEDEDILTLLPDIEELEDEKIINRLSQLITPVIVKTFQPVCFDLESDRKHIYEIAYGRNNDWKECRDETEMSKTLDRFKTLVNNPSNLFIGHNIIEFDCPILGEHGIEFQQQKIWDTLLVEMFLSPDFKNYALKTEHHAIDDAKLTFELFLNQLFRILKTDEEILKNFINYFPSSLIEKINELKYSLNLNWVPNESLNTKRIIFFRPQPQINPQVQKLLSQLNDYPDKTRIIIGPDMYRKDLFIIKDILFVNDDLKNDDDFFLVDQNRVDDLPDANEWSSIVLKQYISYCQANNLMPYWGNLAAAVKIKVAEKTEVINILDKKEEKELWVRGKTFFTSISQLADCIEQICTLDDVELFILDPDLLSVSQKVLLKEIDLNSLLGNSEVDPMWMKFSGGQSIIGLTKDQALKYTNQATLPWTNYWLEKYQFAKYRIYGNQNWEEIVRKIPKQKHHIISLDASQFKKQQVFFTMVKGSNTRKSEVIRFNPESIYRSRYWLYQKMLIEHIESNLTPIILLIQRAEEISSLEKYFESLGFFIPGHNATLGRRMELLHLRKASKKIIITTTDQIGKILHANYLGELNIILDSFNIAENKFIATGTSLINRMMTQVVSTEAAEDYEEVIETANRKVNLPPEKDTFFLLKLQLPYINYLRNLLNSYDTNHTLWMLDPRISDFPELGERWQATKKYMTIWNDPDSYNKDAIEADKHIQSARPVYKLPFETNEIKKILSATFLEKGNYWYDYQEEYLDVIIPGEKDFLISLPTGGGKSLLFQAPSLFKSCFSNRLTLVITPLKALMEDQVKELWNKGFIGSVEYLNSDRSSDTQLIYRSIAGGELSLIFITPERFRSRGFLNALAMRLQSDGGLEYVVFDEAHCVSQWGHEFRPDYLNSAKCVYNIREKYNQNFPILLFSATVSEKVFQDFNLIFA